MLNRRIAVVITAYNYGHFLRECVDSVLAQTRAADEIVVIDDGSSDATPKILDAYADRLRVVRTENGGQAAAFNRGVAETSADLVLFLDADDVLLPHATETILAHWSGDFAHLVFELETIDEDGRSLGRHPGLYRAPERDNRPNLLRTGAFPCPSTSGNVFSRAFLAAAMPMPERRWRISADCYLIRGAALFGLTGHVPRVLGQYRLHFANNYARLGTGAGDEGMRLANRADIADALEDLARARGALLGPERNALREALRHRARAIRAELCGDATPAHVPETEVFRSRVLPILPLETRIDLTRADPACAGLVNPVEASGPVRLDLRLPQTVGPLSVVVWVETDPEPADGAETKADVRSRVLLSIDGVPAARLEHGETRAVMSLPRAPFENDRHIRLTAQAGGEMRARIAGVLVSDGRETRHFPLIGEGGPVPAASLVRGLDPNEWEIDPDGAIALAGLSGSLRLSSGTKGRSVLTLGLGTVAPAGWLAIDTTDLTVFRGRVGQTAELSLPLHMPASCEVTLGIDMRPDDVGEVFRIETVVLAPEAPADRDRPLRAPVSIGEHIAFAAHPNAGAILRDGWSIDGEMPPTVTDPEASLAFAVPVGAEELAIELGLSLILPPAEGEAYIVAISRDGAVLAQAQCEGDGVLEVSLGSAPENGAVDLTVHALIVGPAEETPRPAPVALVSMQLRGALAARSRPLPPARTRRPGLRRVLDRADAAIGAVERADRMSELITCRSALVKIITESDVALPLLIAGQEARLSEVVALAEATRGARPTTAEAAALAALDQAGDETAALKSALVDLLHSPAYRHPFGGDLSRLPAPLLASPEALATYLGAAPELPDSGTHDAYREWLGCLLTSITAAFETGFATGRLYPVAAASLRRLRAVRTIFADGNLAELSRLHARAIERLLADEGAPLAQPRPIRAGLELLRLGVLVRDITPTPEGWALQGMYEGLDRTRFEPVLIRVDDTGDPAPEMFDETLCLSGLSVGEAVRAIRGLDLDLFLTGAYARDFEKVSAIYAHRLAPLQIWHAAVCPTTGGFSSFDVALSCRASESAEAQEHYNEPLAWIEGPKQCAYAFDRNCLTDRERVRAELGVGSGQVALVATAMAHKIGDELLSHWASILNAAQAGVLILAPFAPNWSMAYHREAFEARLVAAGLPADRVSVLPAVPPERLREVLAAADLMLDSFPYTGATTVCEALAQGTPVVTRAGAALRQLTGASWVRAYGLDILVAESDAGYVEIATRLVTDPAALAVLRAHTAARAGDAAPPHDDRAGFGAAYSDALWQIAQDSGRFPDLGAAPDAPFVPSRSPALATSVLRQAPARTLAILASPRTGSTMLCAILNRTPGVVCHFELFHNEMIQYTRETVTDPAVIAERDADPVGFLDAVRRDLRWAGADLVGFKQFAHLSDDVTVAIFADPEVKLIHLTRENILAQYSSEMIARATGKWAQHEARQDAAPEIRFDPADFGRYERHQRGLEADRLARLARAGQTALFLDYVTLGTREMRKQVGDFIGIIIPEGAEPDIRRQNRPDIASRFSNAEEVSAWLAGRGLERWAYEARAGD